MFVCSFGVGLWYKENFTQKKFVRIILVLFFRKDCFNYNPISTNYHELPNLFVELAIKKYSIEIKSWPFYRKKLSLK